jgi:hypothetical protein
VGEEGRKARPGERTGCGERGHETRDLRPKETASEGVVVPVDVHESKRMKLDEID